MIVNFKFETLQPVNIKAISIKGAVTAVMKDGSDLFYRIVYWIDGERRMEWMREDELE
jgi:hypothetical protein